MTTDTVDFTPANGDQLVISRSLAETQDTSYPEGGAFPAAAHERALDLLTMMAQKHSEELDRAILLPIAESSASPLPSKTARAGKFLAFGIDGAPIASSGVAGPNATPVTSYIETLFDDPDALAARSTLGLSIGSDVLAPDGDGSALSGIRLPGEIAMYGGASAPAGWLLCDGAQVSRSTYASLFAAIGTAFGAGDGATTFALPDLRGRSPLGAGQGPGLTSRVLGATGGEEAHALTEAENGPHDHAYNAPLGNQIDFQAGAASHGEAAIQTNTGMSGIGTPHNTMHPYSVINFIIKI